MFVNKKKPEPLKLPEGATESWVVKYPQGRKPFPSLEAAQAVADEARQAPKGWAEITHVVEQVVSPR
jgi:hypothetical protein